VGRCLGPQVLQLFGRGGAPQYLVAVRVAPEARYHVAGPLGLGDPKLGFHLAVGRSLGRRLLGVADAALLEGWILRVTQGHPKEDPLHASQLSVHPRFDALYGKLQGFLVLGV
jgi:hypothetical protein